MLSLLSLRAGVPSLSSPAKLLGSLLCSLYRIDGFSKPPLRLSALHHNGPLGCASPPHTQEVCGLLRGCWSDAPGPDSNFWGSTPKRAPAPTHTLVEVMNGDSDVFSFFPPLGSSWPVLPCLLGRLCFETSWEETSGRHFSVGFCSPKAGASLGD